MFQLAKSIFDIHFIEFCKLCFSCSMKHRLTLLQICDTLSNKFRIKGFHIGKNCKLVYCGCITDIKPLLFKIGIVFFPLLGGASKDNEIKNICFGGIYPCFFEFAKRECGENMFFYGIRLQGIVRFGKDATHIPFFYALISQKCVEVLIFFYEIKFERRVNPRSKLKSNILVGISPTITASLCNQAYGISFFSPLFCGDGKAVKSGNIENLTKSIRVEVGIIQCFPKPKKLDSILVSKPFFDKSNTVIHASNHICKADIVAMFDSPYIDCLIQDIEYKMLHIIFL